MSRGSSGVTLQQLQYFIEVAGEGSISAAADLLYVAHEQDELPGTPNAGQTVCTAFDVSDPFNPKFLAQIPLGSLKLPSGELRNKKSINLVYVRPGTPGQTA